MSAFFADDTEVYLTVDNQNDSTLQKDLDTLQTWERTWDMGFNPSKCQVLHIIKANGPIHSQYTIHGETFECTLPWGKYLKKPDLEHA